MSTSAVPAAVARKGKRRIAVVEPVELKDEGPQIETADPAEDQAEVITVDSERTASVSGGGLHAEGQGIDSADATTAWSTLLGKVGPRWGQYPQ